MIIKTTCKYCEAPINMVVCDDGLNEFPSLKTWTNSIACTRCGDYKHGRRRYVDAITRRCMLLYACQSAGSKSLSKVEATSRDIITVLTRKLADLMARHYQTTNNWQQDFVDVLLEKPQAVREAIRIYERSHTLQNNDNERNE